MTREEAKAVFLNRGYVEVEGGTIYDADKWRESCRVISEWLEQEPCEDAISREAVLDTISELNAISFYEAQEDSKECYYEIRQAIKDLSPVKQEPQTGHWIVHEHAEEFYGRVVDNYECNNCGDWYLNKTNFCPNCGAKMVKPQETKQPEISSFYGLRSYVRERSE